MRIAIHNPLLGECVAETELSRRIYLAAINLGWDAVEVSSSVEIRNFEPDLVLVLHFLAPKVAGYPTYGCMWDPHLFIDRKKTFIKNILSYDGYLCSSGKVNLWLKDILYNTSKKFFILPFDTSCNATPYQIPNIENPHLVYFGTNWDGPRFKDLFLQLDEKEYMEVYGKKSGWQYLKYSYKGELPFDGVSVLKTLNRAGVGLCLHKNEHFEAHIPSMRIFEIAASGAVAICGEHAFIQKNFSDSVLYLSSSLNIYEKAYQISEYIEWIKNNKKEALEMSQKAHQIFSEKFTLENLLLGLLPEHQKLITQKYFTHINHDSVNKQVELIFRITNSNILKTKRAFDSIINQTYKNITTIVVKDRKLEDLDILLEEYKNKIAIKVVQPNDTICKSTLLWAGLNAVSAEYFCLLDHDDLIHPNHIYSLVSLLNEYHECGVAYSGSICVWELDDNEYSSQVKPKNTTVTASLGYFSEFDILKFLSLKKFISCNGFLVRSCLINKTNLKDPELNFLEDFLLVMKLSTKTNFIFSHEATCENSYIVVNQAKSVFENKQKIIDSACRINRIMWNQEFPYKQTLSSFSSMQAELEKFRIEFRATQKELEHSEAKMRAIQEELQRSQAIITAMESSKFWRLRKAWFQLKRRMGILGED